MAPTVWQFNDPVYQERLRSAKRKQVGGLIGLMMYPEPRHLLVAACFLATLTAYVERTGFSIAYTLLAKEANVDEATKGKVMSAFYWGYGISQIPGGMAAQKYGGSVVLTVSFLLWSTASMLTPGRADSTNAMMMARFIVGASQGFVIPSIHTALSLWVPAKERAKAVSLTTSGMYLGSAAAMELLPMVSRRYGAAFILRLVAIIGYIWVFLWRRVVARLDSAGTMDRIPTSQVGGKTSHVAERRYRRSKTPWKELLTSAAVWSIVINNYTFHYAFYIVMNWLPTYFDKVLNTSIESVGVAKTLPYLAMFLTSNVGGWSGDYFIKKLGVPVATGRKIVNTLGFWTAGVALLLMPTARSVASGIFFTTSALACCGFSRGGFSVNHMDIAPKYAGMVMYVFVVLWNCVCGTQLFFHPGFLTS